MVEMKRGSMFKASVGERLNNEYWSKIELKSAKEKQNRIDEKIQQKKLSRQILKEDLISNISNIKKSKP